MKEKRGIFYLPTITSIPPRTTFVIFFLIFIICNSVDLNDLVTHYSVFASQIKTRAGKTFPSHMENDKRINTRKGSQLSAINN